MSQNKVMRVVLGAMLLMLLSSAAHAEPYGLLNGRLANSGNLPTLSFEGAFITGEVGDADYQHIGGRINYRVTPLLLVFGDFGISEVESLDGNPFGFGAFYSLPDQRVFSTLDMAFKGSYHSGDFDGIDITGLSFEVLVSGQNAISANGLGWYANVGFHRLTTEFFGQEDSETEIGFGGGLVLPTNSGQFYGGLDSVDGLTFGVGYRFFL